MAVEFEAVADRLLAQKLWGPRPESVTDPTSALVLCAVRQGIGVERSLLLKAIASVISPRPGAAVTAAAFAAEKIDTLLLEGLISSEKQTYIFRSDPRLQFEQLLLTAAGAAAWSDSTS